MLPVFIGSLISIIFKECIGGACRQLLSENHKCCKTINNNYYIINQSSSTNYDEMMQLYDDLEYIEKTYIKQKMIKV